jgi:hypothetical protein
VHTSLATSSPVQTTTRRRHHATSPGTGRQVWNRQRTDFDLVDPGNTGLTRPAETASLIGQLRNAHITLTYNPDTRTLRTGDSSAVTVVVDRDR